MDKETRKEYDKQYRLLHKDEIREKDKKRNIMRREYKAIHSKGYREQHQLELKNKKKEYYDAHKEEISKQHKEYYSTHKAEFRKKRVTYLFGIDDTEYSNMVEKQNNLCAVCGNPETQTRNGVIKRLAIDHNHVTGKVRKLLCNNCNISIGYAKESPEILRKMIEYLEEFENVD